MGAHCDWMSDHGHSHGIGLDVARVHSHGGSGQFLLHRSRDHFLSSMWKGSLGDRVRCAGMPPTRPGCMTGFCDLYQK